jgi:hypothetical protein
MVMAGNAAGNFRKPGYYANQHDVLVQYSKGSRPNKTIATDLKTKQNKKTYQPVQ